MPCIVMAPGKLPQLSKAFDLYQIYNCLDAAITAQLVQPMLQQCNSNHLRTYEREMRLQRLCLELSTKGFPLDQEALITLLYDLEKEQRRALHILHQFCRAVYFRPLNPNSPQQVASLFYDHLGIPPVYKYDFKTKQRRISTDRDSLEKLRDQYPLAVPFVNAILAVREPTKLAGVFKKGIEPGSRRLRCNVSPSGTETGRLASQTNPFGRGTNSQNLNDRVRRVIAAPEGWVCVYIDLKTAESIAVGFISGDRGYIDACLSGDLHTTVAQLVWRTLAWSKTDEKANRRLADQLVYRDFSYRDLSKRGGHATNYYGKAATVAKALKVATTFIEAFQRDYLNAFPGIGEWHLDVISRIQREGILINRLGRERRFWGRSSDPATHREAIAFDPQSLVADVMNEGLMQVQRWLLKECPQAMRLKREQLGLLAQVHDAGLFFLPKAEADDLIPEMQKRIIYPVDFGPLGEMRIPADAEVGLNWGKLKDKNPAGLRKWRPGLEL